jgi:hypothetical protein
MVRPSGKWSVPGGAESSPDFRPGPRSRSPPQGSIPGIGRNPEVPTHTPIWSSTLVGTGRHRAASARGRRAETLVSPKTAVRVLGRESTPQRRPVRELLCERAFELLRMTFEHARLRDCPRVLQRHGDDRERWDSRQLWVLVGPAVHSMCAEGAVSVSSRRSYQQ